MQELQAVRRGGRVLWLKPEQIEPSPGLPRRSFEREALGELADSIGRYGVLQPLTVRRREGRYELVAGQRRLRAARMAGLEEVPCLAMELDEEDCAVLALVENLQRQPLDMTEEARSLANLAQRFSLGPGETARRLGRSLASVEERLRLLELSEDMREELRLAGLGPRHGRALLRLEEPCRRWEALRAMVAESMSGARAERYVEEMLRPPAEKSEGRRRFVLKDARIFINSLRHSVELMRQGGVDVVLDKEESEEELAVTIHIRR